MLRMFICSCNQATPSPCNGNGHNWVTMIFGQAQTIWSILNEIDTNSDRIPFFCLVNYSFNTRNIGSNIGQIVTDF